MASVDVPVAGRDRFKHAEGKAIAQPLRLRRVIAAIRRSAGSNGCGRMRRDSGRLLPAGQAGLYVEPTSASKFPAMGECAETGAIKTEGHTVLVLLTGSGLRHATIRRVMG